MRFLDFKKERNYLNWLLLIMSTNSVTILVSSYLMKPIILWMLSFSILTMSVMVGRILQLNGMIGGQQISVAPFSEKENP